MGSYQDTAGTNSTQASNPESSPGPATSPDSPVEVTAKQERLGRLGPLLLVSHIAWAIPSTGAGTLIQAMVADQRGDSKVTSLALLTAIGAGAGVIATIVAGALSDRTRSRFGRRNPWILGGALASATGLTLGGSTSVFALQVVFFAVYQAGLNAMLSSLQALLPDRVAKASLGKASALSGVGYLLGTTAGGFYASAAIGHPAAGIQLVPWTMAAASLLVFFLAKEASNVGEPREHHSVGTLLKSLLPPKDHDFLWAFAGRFCVILALFTVAFYQLYLFTDLLGLTKERAGEVIALGTVVLGASALIASAVGGVLSDRIGRRKPPVVAASVFIGIAAIPALISPSVPTLIVFYAIGGIGYGTYLSVDQALMVEILPRGGSEAKDLGFLSVANTAPVMVAPLVAAGLVTTVGYRALFAAAFLLAMAGAVCILMIRRVP